MSDAQHQPAASNDVERLRQLLAGLSAPAGTVPAVADTDEPRRVIVRWTTTPLGAFRLHDAATGAVVTGPFHTLTTAERAAVRDGLLVVRPTA